MKPGYFAKNHANQFFSTVGPKKVLYRIAMAVLQHKVYIDGKEKQENRY